MTPVINFPDHTVNVLDYCLLGDKTMSTLYQPYLIRFKGVQFGLHHPTTDYSNNIHGKLSNLIK
jgi:hypothetical protein